MRTGVVIAYNKDGAAKIIASGPDIAKQRVLFRKLADQARSDEGFERIEWFLTPHKVVRRRHAVNIAISETPPQDDPTGNKDNENPGTQMPGAPANDKPKEGA